jgi:hypothetical protein
MAGRHCPGSLRIALPAVDLMLAYQLLQYSFASWRGAA